VPEREPLPAMTAALFVLAQKIGKASLRGA
jgi:hypothetical protein